jgi:hypothetical protein
MHHALRKETVAMMLRISMMSLAALGLIACGPGPEIMDDTFGPTPYAPGVGTTTGTGTGAGTGTGTASGSATGAAATGADPGTDTPTCRDDDYSGWLGEGPGCFGEQSGGIDADAPNGNDAGDDAFLATYLGEVESPDGCGSVVGGVINGSDDEDWYYYHGTDSLLGFVTPTREWNHGQDLRICSYVACDNDTEDPGVTCGEGSGAHVSARGLQGCCSYGTSSAFDMTYCCTTWCSGADDAHIYFSVSAPSAEADACIDYEIGWHY